MASHHITKGKQKMVVNDRQLDRFLADGWERYEPDPRAEDAKSLQEASGGTAALRPGQKRMTNGKSVCVCDQHQVAKLKKAGWKLEGESKQPQAAPAATTPSKGGSNDAEDPVEQGKSGSDQREELGANAEDEGGKQGRAASQSG